MEFFRFGPEKKSSQEWIPLFADPSNACRPFELKIALENRLDLQGLGRIDFKGNDGAGLMHGYE